MLLRERMELPLPAGNLAAAVVWAVALVAVFSLPGCTSRKVERPAPVEETFDASTPLKLLVVDDHRLAGAMEQKWRSRGEGPLVVKECTSAELAGLTQLEADLVVLPCAALGALAERKLIIPLPEELLRKPELGRADVFTLPRLQEPTWAQKTYAVPLGSPQLVLYYRRDLFEQLKLTPPETWADYQRLAEQLNDVSRLPPNLAPAGGAWFGAAEPCAPGTGGLLLLARAAGLVRHRSHFQALFDQHSFAPLIDSPPYVRALEELVAATKASSPEAAQLSLDGAREAILGGHCAMAITWPAHAANASKAAATPAIGFVELPGSSDVYNFPEERWDKLRDDDEHHVPLLAASGRLAAVTAESTQRRAALAALAILGGREWMALVSPASEATGLVRESGLARAGDWIDAGLDSTAARQFGEVVQRSQQRTLWLTAPRLPAHAKYLAALDMAVQAAVTRQQEPRAALQAAAAQWRKITQELGEKNQHAAYLRSLGLEP